MERLAEVETHVESWGREFDPIAEVRHYRSGEVKFLILPRSIASCKLTRAQSARDKPPHSAVRAHFILPYNLLQPYYYASFS